MRICASIFFPNSCLFVDLDLNHRHWAATISGGSRIFPGGALTPKIAIIFQNFAKNCMKMKEFGPPGGARVPGSPLGSANDHVPLLPLIRSGPTALWMLRPLMSLVIPATPIWKEGIWGCGLGHLLGFDQDLG